MMYNICLTYRIQSKDVIKMSNSYSFFINNQIKVGEDQKLQSSREKN